MLVLKRPIRRFKQAMQYWIPRRLTLKGNHPAIYAWFWWNF